MEVDIYILLLPVHRSGTYSGIATFRCCCGRMERREHCVRKSENRLVFILGLYCQQEKTDSN